MNLFSANINFRRSAQVFALSPALGLQDVRILSGAVAGAIGPAALRVGAGLRANF